MSKKDTKQAISGICVICVFWYFNSILKYTFMEVAETLVMWLTKKENKQASSHQHITSLLYPRIHVVYKGGI